MEQNAFKRLENGNIILNGLIWGDDPGKAIDIKNELTGNRVYSIKFEEIDYYPYSIYVAKTKK